MNSSVADHLHFCKHSASYDDFNILTRKNKKFLLKLKGSLLLLRDNSSLQNKVTLALLYLFNRS